jgi:hypothetical protein
MHQRRWVYCTVREHCRRASVVIDMSGIHSSGIWYERTRVVQHEWHRTHLLIGLGALASPLSATQFAQLPRWSFHFLVSLGVALLNAISLVITVKGRSLEGAYCPAQQGWRLIILLAVLGSIGSPPMGHRGHVEMEMSTSISKSDEPSNEIGVPAFVAPSKSSMHQILRSLTVQLMAAYILVYVGVEVTIGGKPTSDRWFV